ncbi:MAG: hemerythrin domain-containing protein [Actinomadura rubrobrunea]|nr:hemerythrin domain-containing protein [Actinomadura rubrobrunea]
MDAVDLLVHDHRRVEQLFRDYHCAASDRQRRAVVELLVRELSRHAAVEELVFYPFAERVLDDREEIARYRGEHLTVKRLLAELDRLSEGDERTGRLLAGLRTAVAEHVRAEEGDLMVRVRGRVGERALLALARDIRRAKERAPTRPHPAAPDRPPALTLAAPVAAVYDRVRDRMQGRPRT